MIKVKSNVSALRITSGGKDKSNHVEYVNLLNLPADAETRACFVAEEGNRWVSIDYVGQESFLMASIANDEAIIHELTYGDKDLHTLTAKIVYPYIPKDMSAKEVKIQFHKERQESKGYEFCFNYGGTYSTIMKNFGLTPERAQEIENSYMKGFAGLKRYQDFRRKDWFNKGYILLNPKTGHKAYIYDYDKLLEDKKWMSTLDWTYYREMKKTCPECDTVQRVRHFFKRKSASEKQSINYPMK